MLLHPRFKASHELSEPPGHLVLQEQSHVVGRHEALQLDVLWGRGDACLDAFVECVTHLRDLIVIHLCKGRVRMGSG